MATLIGLQLFPLFQRLNVLTSMLKDQSHSNVADLLVWDLDFEEFLDLFMINVYLLSIVRALEKFVDR